MQIKLGMTVKDKITGFEGVVTGLVEYISGCNQALIIPGLDEKGQPGKSHWFDEQRCVQVGDSIIALENGEAPGADTPAPKR